MGSVRRGPPGDRRHVVLQGEHMGHRAGEKRQISLAGIQAVTHEQQIADGNVGTGVARPFLEQVVPIQGQRAVGDALANQHPKHTLCHRPAQLGSLRTEPVGIALGDHASTLDDHHGAHRAARRGVARGEFRVQGACERPRERQIGLDESSVRPSARRVRQGGAHGGRSRDSRRRVVRVGQQRTAVTGVVRRAPLRVALGGNDMSPVALIDIQPSNQQRVGEGDGIQVVINDIADRPVRQKMPRADQLGSRSRGDAVQRAAAARNCGEGDDGQRPSAVSLPIGCQPAHAHPSSRVSGNR